jgi:CheY-like chemotaxis protein
LNLNDIVPETEQMLLHLIGEDITLQTVLDPDLGLVKADPAQIDQVVMNLAVNARDAMPTGGRLTITTTNVHVDQTYATRHVRLQAGPYVMLAMSDTGCGMDTETQRHMFEPFFTTKVEGKGTGLGLSIVYGIVKQSGGHIEVESKPKQGTTFRLYFPKVEDVVESVAPQPVMAQPLVGNETILLVEDEEPLRRLISYLLRRWGYMVLEAQHSEEALHTLEQHAGPIHLLLTDVVLPGISGCKLWERVKTLQPTIRVLFMSGHAEETITQYGVIGRDRPFLKKPFAPAVLGQKVREVLEVG